MTSALIGTIDVVNFTVNALRCKNVFSYWGRIGQVAPATLSLPIAELEHSTVFSTEIIVVSITPNPRKPQSNVGKVSGSAQSLGSRF